MVLVIGIILLLTLIIKFKMNTYVSLIITAVVVGLGLGMPASQIATTIQNGIGSQLGKLALVFGFGASYAGSLGYRRRGSLSDC